ncbi:MAG: hypothetical protein K0Q75_1758 [Anaerospora sp.]|nr:hypothetical protein [Anaerospora sp.]
MAGEGKLIIIEAGDGCGKATQTARLYERLTAEGYPVKKVEFPDYASPSSALIKMYLGGEFGTQPDAVNAYAASAFFAVDRFASYKTSWGEWYRQGGIILADRYTTSNMVHQAVKIADESAKDSFLDWLWDLEFVKFGLPVPNQVLFLDVPPDLSSRLLAERSVKAGDEPDIHERDMLLIVLVLMV